ncbi:unnamed protein product [Penicillium salamii]|nr:unnamed protein product [Penicillium salamii]
MQSSGYKRRKTAGFAYPAIPARDQDIPPYSKDQEIPSYGPPNKPISLRTVLVSFIGDSSPADAFRAESITHIDKENEQFVRTHHPSLSSQEGVRVSESAFGEPVWLVLSPLAASQSVYAGGRPIHYFPGDYAIDTSYGPFGPLIPRTPEKYNEHFDRYINPRRFLTPADLDSLRELFPEAVGVHLLIAGFLVILFEEERHVLDACNTVWPLELAGLQVCFQLTHLSFTTAPVESGNILKETSKQGNNAFAGCLGLKLKLQNGSTAVTTVTHGFVRNSNPSPSRFDTGLRVFAMMVDQMKQKMRRFLPFKAGEYDRALVMAKETPTDNTPVGKQVSLAVSNRTIGTITHTYDTPSNDKPFPAGYNHDLCLISGRSLPDVVSPPGYPSVTGWATYSKALDGQDCYVVAQNASTGGIREVRGVINSNLFRPNLFRRAAVIGTGYSWDKIRRQCNAFLLWHTEHLKAPADGTSGPPLCLGRPSDTAAQAVVFQNFQHSCQVAHVVGIWNKKQYSLVKGGFILPQEIRDSTILSGATQSVPPCSIP